MNFELKCMNNLRFYIFGVPDGFDIYQEDLDVNVKNYYQCFYDESIKENTRFAIHRKVNGDVTYTFLKYHLISKENRTNAFLGLSVVVEDGYYADVSSLYNLFNYAYEDILQKQILLQPTQNGLSAKFLVTNFEEGKGEIERIESFIINTLKSPDYAMEFHSLDATFVEGKQSASLKIPFQIYNDDVAKEQQLNQLVVDKLKVYSWLSLSPDYQKKKQPVVTPGKVDSVVGGEYDEELDPKTKQDYTENFEECQGQILSAYEMLLKEQRSTEYVTDVKSLNKHVREILNTLKDYAKKQDDLKELLAKYAGIAVKLDTLMNKLNERTVSDTTFRVSEKKEEKTSKSDEPEEEGKRKGGEWQRYAKGGIVVICLLGCFLYFGMHYISKPVPDSVEPDVPVAPVVSDTTQSDNNLDSLVEKFEKAIQNDNPEDAIKYYTEVHNEYGQEKVRDFEQKLEDKFNECIGKCDFEMARQWYEILPYEYKGNFYEELRDAFKSYIAAYKNNIDRKEELISKIALAKENGYAYENIDSDLAQIRRLSVNPPPVNPPSVEYKLVVKKEGTAGSEKVSVSEHVQLDRNKKYTITVDRWEEEAAFSFGDANPGRGVTLNQSGKGRTATLTIDVRNEAVNNQKFEVKYKKSGTTIFVITFIIIQRDEDLAI